MTIIGYQNDGPCDVIVESGTERVQRVCPYCQNWQEHILLVSLIPPQQTSTAINSHVQHTFICQKCGHIAGYSLYQEVLA